MSVDPRMYNLAHNGERVANEPTITHHNPPTMDRKEFLKQVAETFKSNPNAEKFYVTSDGMCFPLEGPARNHSKMLGPHGSGVECITRESIERHESGKPATGKPKENAASKANANAEAGEGGEGGEGGEAGEGGEGNGGGAAAGEGTASTEGGQPGKQPAATAAKKAAPAKKSAAKKTGKKK